VDDLQLNYEWTGPKNAAYDEVYVYDVTLGIAYGIGWDGFGNKLLNPIFPNQGAEAMGTLVYVGHTIQMQADLRTFA
jgi:hypothetical protein